VLEIQCEYYFQRPISSGCFIWCDIRTYKHYVRVTLFYSIWNTILLLIWKIKVIAIIVYGCA